MKKINISLTLNIIPLILIPNIVLANQNDEIPAGSYNLHIDRRPSVPYPRLRNYNKRLTEEGAGPDYPVEFSRHHIIPFNLLRAFYNRLAERNQLFGVSAFWTSWANNLRFYASSNNVNCINLGDNLINAANLALAQIYSWVRSGGSTTAPGFDPLEQYYAWLPGNLFIGPSRRSDDPHEGFERNARVVVGSEHFNVLSRIYSNMMRFINGDESVLNAISHDMNIIAKRRSVFSLNSQCWEYKNGKYKLITNNFRNKKYKYISLYSNKEICADMLPNIVEKIITVL